MTRSLTGPQCDSALCEAAIRRQADDVVLIWSGEIDGTSAPGFQAQVEPLLAADRSILIDLSGVTYFGSQACRLLVDLSARSTAVGAVLTVSGPSRIARLVLQVTALDWLIRPDKPAIS